MRIVSAIMVLAMLLSFAACVKTPDPAETTAPADTTAAPDESTAPEVDLSDSLPAETFDGEEILIWTGGYDQYFASYEETTDVVYESVHERNNAVQDRFDVVLKYMYTPEDAGRAWGDYKVMSQSIRAGDEIDLVAGGVSYIVPWALEGAYLNMAENEYLDFSRPWWADYVNDTIEINERLYAVSGWFDFGTIVRSSAMFFNTEMAADHDVGDIYQIVRDGKWTYDKLAEISEKVSDDVNNDGVYDGADRYGFASKKDTWNWQIYTCGYKFVQHNEDGTYTMTGLSDDIVDAFETVRPIIRGDKNWYRSYYTHNDGIGFNADRKAECFQKFGSKEILFLLLEISYASSEELRNIGTYGIIPVPKFSEEQEFYGTPCGPNASAVPTTTGDARITSIILEALNAETYRTVRPAYYEVAMSYKYVNDPESAEMMDYVFEKIYCDFVYTWMDSGLGRDLLQTVNETDNIASHIESLETSCNAKIKTIVDKIMALPE